MVLGVIFQYSKCLELLSRNKGIDRYRTDFSQGFFYSPKFFVKKYTIWFKDPCKKAILKAKFKVLKNTVLNKRIDRLCTAQHNLSIRLFRYVRGHSILLQMGEILRDLGPFLAFEPL